METHYDVLGVSIDASDMEIRKAYEFQQKQCPAGSDTAKRISTAYLTLSDAQKRLEYDISLAKRSRESSVSIRDRGGQDRASCNPRASGEALAAAGRAPDPALCHSVPTKIRGVHPLTWHEMEDQIKLIGEYLDRWSDLCACQLPSDADKREFLSTMTMFHERISRLQNKYYDLVESALKSYEISKRGSDAFPLNPGFEETILIMKTLPDVRKKWLRHKKPVD